MKKSLILLGILVVLGVGYFFSQKLDYTKIVFVLPSSERTSSPYFYKKDGDFFLADDLKKGFEKIGYTVEYRFREDYDDLKLGNIGNIIYFKGYYPFKHLPSIQEDGRKRILYLYYVEGLNPDILYEADMVVSASQKLINESLIPRGLSGIYVPQFTNPERFKSTKKEDDKYHKVLFVGSDHTRRGRKCVNYALSAGAELSVYGKFWEKSLDLKYLKGKFIDNNELYKYYASSDIVLNDHRDDMKYYGFVSNRIYDVSASGGFVLTDYLPEIEKVYGDSIATYTDLEDFRAKLAYYQAHPEVRAEMAKRAQKITLENFTNIKVAQIFDGIFKNIKK